MSPALAKSLMIVELDEPGEIPPFMGATPVKIVISFFMQMLTIT